MKLTIVSQNTTGWHQQQIINAAKAKGIRVNTVGFKNPKHLEESVAKCGEVVIWRASGLDHKSERTVVAAMAKDRIIINQAVFLQPFITHKYYQQKLLSSTSALAEHAITTFRVKKLSDVRGLIDGGQLSYPFIVKPNLGKMGIGVHLIKSPAELKQIKDLRDQVIQQFIPNTHDWRVIVVGGRPLGALKRIAKPGSHLNNISQGATALKETDQNVLNNIYEIAVKTASLFNLTYGGIDIVRDKETGRYYVLEANTAPQWDGDFGFNAIVGVDVAKELVDLAVLLSKRTGKNAEVNVPARVEDYYKKHISYSKSELFHFASRMWSWKQDKWSRQRLDELRDYYMGSSLKETEAKIKELVAKDHSIATTVKVPARLDYIAKYPRLKLYNSVLFKVIFCDSLYGLDIRPIVRRYISDKEMLELFAKLNQDVEAICTLSTMAINFMYLLKNYFKDDFARNCDILLDPNQFITYLSKYDQLIKQEKLTQKQATKLKIYLLTHVIIGNSLFYQKPIEEASYRSLCKEAEKIVKKNYFDVSLDNKLELLVCAKLCGYKSELRPLILNEAKKSLSWAGDFIVDKADPRLTDIGNGLRKSEHRNVLYLMATSKDGRFDTLPQAAKKKSPKLQTIGRLCRVGLPKYGMLATARVDTGASFSSICASDIKEKNRVLSFKLLNPKRSNYIGQTITTKDYTSYLVTNTANIREKRFAVDLEIVVNDEAATVTFTLADRSNMLYPVLLGRNFIRGRYRVDISRQFIKPRKRK